MFDFNHWLNRFPGTNFHELNIDWLVEAVKSLALEIQNFEIVNQFTYEGSWDITKQYKKFAIVTVNGTEGYISLQPVPAGIDISNGEYWALIADYTAVISGLGARILALENEVQDIENRLPIDFDRVVFIGDSYTSAGSLGADVDKRFSTLVSNELGLTEHNYAVGGTGYCYGPTPYPTQVGAAIADFTNNHYDQTKVKYCFVMGNRNDGDGSYNYSTYASAVDSVLTNLKNFFTNATIIVIPALWDAKPCKISVVHYASIINEICELHDRVLYFSDAFTWLTGHEDEILWQSGADVHPNTVGHKRIAAHVMNCLNGNNFNETILYEFAPTTVAAGISDAYCQIKVVNGTAYFQFRFKTSTDTIGGDLMTFTINNLSLRNVFIMNKQVYTEVRHRSGYIFPKVTCMQYLTKTDDTTGSFTMNVYCYSEGGNFDDTDWNWVEFSIPYGIDIVTYN